MAIVIQIDVDDSKVQAMLQRLIAFGGNQRKAMESIADYGETSTKQRFADQVGPDGKQWKQSLRAQVTGTNTLMDDLHLLDSIVNNVGDNGAEWGSGKIYAAIHQFGGDIVPKSADSLFFRLPDGSGRKVKKVTIPPRPYLGINDQDEENILDIINKHLASAVDA